MSEMSNLHDMVRSLLRELNVPLALDVPNGLTVSSPISGQILGTIATQSVAEAENVIAVAHDAFLAWRKVPAPVRGELVRLFGEELRIAKEPLAQLVTLECGKIISEGRGEVQEMIDICDFAVGLSRQLYGLTMPSERPGHAMREVWHPLGVIGVISAFNFPVAVWAWNAALALVCGDSVVWKPSEKTPLVAHATLAIFARAMTRFRQSGHDVPDNICTLLTGGAELGEALAKSTSVPLVSATGSTRMGRHVARDVGGRLGRSLLELGGNNAMIVTPSADLNMAVRSILFSAVGTAGQRCTTLRRLLVHEDILPQLLPQLEKAYTSLRIGNPFTDGTLVGPLIDEDAVRGMEQALKDAEAQGGKILAGGGRFTDAENGFYVRPALVQMPAQTDIVRHETFAPILYVLTWRDIDQAIALQNDVPQGLSSCLFTLNMREAEAFLSPTGSDCGIANINIGPSGAEIGGAFGGEKDTGGGRESGSDSWKNYMRRQTQTVNYSAALPLAQGVVFDL